MRAFVELVVVFEGGQVPDYVPLIVIILFVHTFA